ncbi:MAG: AAA family ATPase [Verrucomicrobiota bacterium]|nr:AAA family ATPase [Verrucomicrobiota bacterium]
MLGTGKHDLMLNVPEITKTPPPQAVPATAPMPCGPGKSADSPAIICDLADSDAFVETYRKPHVPVMSSFGAGRLHVCRLNGSFDLDKAASENADAMFRSIRWIHVQNAKTNNDYWDDLTFQLGRRAYVYMDEGRTIGFAITPGEAEALAKKFARAYSQPPVKSDAGGDFYLIQVESSDIKCHKVSLPQDTVLTAEALNIHYGPGSHDWHQGFVEKLRRKDRGLTLFEGLPGTGKTFYIRHLMGVLKESHRFYFIQTANLEILSSAEFIKFWADERRRYADRQFVVVMEDSDAALMTRGSDNRELVAAILNLTDGLLADFLRLHIICTINCTASDIDPALLRPGRLLCHRIFNRLDYADALRLAESLGRKLPTAGDYSLAEIFADNEKHDAKSRSIGFAG